MAIRIEGTNKTFGMHAAGVVISKDPLDEIVPLQGATIGRCFQGNHRSYYMEDVGSPSGLAEAWTFLGLKKTFTIDP